MSDWMQTQQTRELMQAKALREAFLETNERAQKRALLAKLREHWGYNK